MLPVKLPSQAGGRDGRRGGGIVIIIAGDIVGPAAAAAGDAGRSMSGHIAAGAFGAILGGLWRRRRRRGHGLERARMATPPLTAPALSAGQR